MTFKSYFVGQPRNGDTPVLLTNLISLSLSLYCHLKPTSFGLDDLLYMRVQRSGLKAVFEGLPYDS